MVQIEDIRAGFVSRLKKALAASDIDQWGAGVRLAKMTGVTPKASSKWLNGESMPGPAKMQAIAQGLAVPIEWLQHGIGAAPAVFVMTSPVESNMELLGDLSVWDEGDPLDEDDCEVPYYAEVEFAGGDGMTEVIEVAGRHLRFSNATLKAAGVDCKSAAVARVKGKSMERLIMDGAAIGFDMSDTSIIDGEIYAFNHGGMLRTKYLYRLPHGAIRISSENGDEYPDEQMSADQWREEVKMLGRVFWWSTVRRSPRRK